MSHLKPIGETLGKPFYLAADTLTDLPPGQPVVTSEGKPDRWEGMPEDAGLVCSLRAMGKIWIPKKGVAHKIYEALADPKNHPKLLRGVEDSKNVRTLEDADPAVLLHVHNLQDGDGFQFLSEIVARDIGYGVVYVQKSMGPILDWVAPEDLFPERRTDTLKSYEGQIQILEVANGTVIVMEFSGAIARIHAPNCDYAADSDWFPNLFGGDHAVKQRIEARLENLYRLAVGE